MATANPIHIQKYLGGIGYPANRQEIINHARAQGADDKVIETLEQLPDEEFETPADISSAIGRMH